MRRAVTILAAMSFAASTVIAHAAGTIEIAPTTVDLQPGKAGLLYLTNNGRDPLVIQIQPMDWTQSNDANVLAPSDTLIASPPLLRIAPGQRQIVRVLADGGAREAQYRLLVSELPGPNAASAVNVLLQFNIPVFVAQEPAKPVAAWSAVADGDKLKLALHNGGDTALKISAIALVRDNGTSTPIPCGLTYVLPRAEHTWTAPLGNTVSLHVAARDERSGMALDADIPVQR